MSTHSFSLALLGFLLAAGLCPGADPEKEAAAEKAPVREADVVVYGGTSAGIAAAVQVKRMGRSVIVVEPTRRIGGLTTGGLGQTDIGNKQVVGGISREFYRAVRDWYSKPEHWIREEAEAYMSSGQSRTEEGEDTMWTFEPSAALAIYQRWVEENDIPVVYNERLDRTGEGKTEDHGTGWLVAAPGNVAEGVVVKDGRIVELVMESGARFRGDYFLDCTYEGDLLAAAGISFTVGRESNATYGETYNGVQTENATKHQLVDGVDPHVSPGDPDSDLLPGIDPTGPGEEGGADHRAQAYCFRMCLTDHPDNRIPFSKPEGFDEQRYELLFRNYEAGFSDFPWINSKMPNRKTDTNNKHGFSTDFIGQNYDYPEAGYDEREAIVEAHRTYQKGLMWVLANHPRIPAEFREEFSRWGTSKDEFAAEDGWQEQLYIREARRMIADTVMSQAHCENRLIADDSIGMAAYTMDSHNTQRYVDHDGHARNEGDVQKGGFPPYPISYRSIVPRRDECENLAVPVGMSASHIAFGSIRMEPVFMILAQSAATAAVHAIEEDGAALQEIDRARLRERLLADEQILEYSRGLPLGEIEGRVLDDTQATLDGEWQSSSLSGGVHNGYRHDSDARDGKARAVFEWSDLPPGEYEVQVAYTANPNRATNTPVDIESGGETRRKELDQKKAPSIDELFEPVGTVATEGGITVTISNEDTDGYVIIDAVRLLPR
ncbi:MAG: FAD-dependent oxidoreductase [Verrucomicrobiales bacterium]